MEKIIRIIPWRKPEKGMKTLSVWFPFKHERELNAFWSKKEELAEGRWLYINVKEEIFD